MLEEENKALKTILKKGDIYDNVARRKNVKPHSHFLLTTNILLFSRIAYIGVLIADRIKTYFAPLEEAKAAQDSIRSSIGVNVDIICSKKEMNSENYKEKKKLLVLYEEPHIKPEVYVSNLRRILNFCELHNMDDILLSCDDIQNTFLDIDLEEYQCHTRGYILGRYFCDETRDSLLVLTREELLDLIRKLEVQKIDKKLVAGFGGKIEDVTIKNAIKDFGISENLERLKEVVHSRLTIKLNSDSSYRDKELGKLLKSIKVKDGYVQVIVTNLQGIQVESAVVTLYEYLEVPDYRSLLKRSKTKEDSKETFLIAALYLYLYQQNNIVLKPRQKPSSFLDKIYNQYKTKQKSEKIPALYNKRYKWAQNFLQGILAIYITVGLVFIPLVTGASLDAIQFLVFKNPDSSIARNMIEYILTPYMRSFEFENQLLNRITQHFEGLNLEAIKISGITGDSNNDEKEKIVATVERFSDDFLMPSYFAVNYAESGSYHFGQVNYNMVTPTLTANQMENIKPAFEIVYHVGETDLKKMIRSKNICFFDPVYPVGNHYVLTSICIRDFINPQLELTINQESSRGLEQDFSLEDIQVLKTMTSPEIHFIYGIDEAKTETFTSIIQKTGDYTKLLPEDVKSAILRGLNLEENASMEEIYDAIKGKSYSKTPLKDAGLDFKIKFMNEEEFYETIASLDSLVCNLAATLVVEVNDDLTYVEGYLNANDQYITNLERHGWAINPEGSVIEVTPVGEIEEAEEEQSFIENMITFGVENHIPKYAILTLISLIFYKKIGKKMVLKVRISRVEKLLLSPDIEKSYIAVMDTLYGGTNIPYAMNSCDLVTKLDEELESLTIEELKELKREVKANTQNDQVSKNAQKLIGEIPFIRKNVKQLKKVFKS